ncbi:MAG: imidazole glycerol phosphate synthase subunit HisH [Brevinematia bacterium]
MLVIIDYGMGNLASVGNAFSTLGIEVKISSSKDDVKNARWLVLPGVGAFEDAMKNLKRLGLDNVIHDYVSSGKPFLGICLGMQLLFDRSYENGEFEGLGILKGRVVRFEVKLPVPHMGWNSVKVLKKGWPFENIEEDSFFYFDHSYYVIPEEDNILGLSCNYGVDFPAAIWKDNIIGFQFHPEKSYKKGLRLLKNFINNINWVG